MKRPATEDYHFLNKLRKYGPIDYWPEIKVFPSSRRSNRVFLGTGHFLSTYRQQPQGELPLFVPSPASFQFLSLTLRSVDDYFQNESSLKEHLENNPVIYSFFVEHKVLTRLESLAKHSSDRKSFAKKALQVLDGLQTLRLLKAIDSHRATTSCLLAWVNDLLRTDEKIDDPVALLSAFRHKDLEWSRCCPF